MMKKLLALALLSTCLSAYAENSIIIERRQLGSGTPAPAVTTGTQWANSVNDGMYHVPQYLPGFPTAATIWPRTITTPCVRTPTGQLTCNGYNWRPEFGRAEYLFVTPEIVQPPQVIKELVPVPVIIEREVIREVPVKKIRE